MTANAQLLPVSAATEIDTSLSGSQEGREGARQTILMQSGTPGAVTMRRADPFTVCNIKGTSGSPIFWLIISVDCCKEASDAMGMVFSRQSLVSLTWSIGVDMVVKRWFPLQSDGGGGGGGCRGARGCRRQVGHRHLDSIYSNGASNYHIYFFLGT